MKSIRTLNRTGRWLVGAAAALGLAAGGAAQTPDQPPPPAQPRATDDELPPAAQIQWPEAADIPPERLRWHIPDPEQAIPVFTDRLEAARQADDEAAIRYNRRILDRIRTIMRDDRVHLSFEEALRRTLENNYAIEVFRYNPAIETTRIVEAEAAFDAIFFTNVTKNNVDRPTATQLLSTDLDQTNITTGLGKLLPLGTQVQASYSLRRTFQTFQFQQINPEYFSSLVLEVRQPMLRGFGLDFNQANIVIARNNRGISDLAFRRQVRDTLRQLEEIYWRLVQVRRDVVVTARLLADFEAIYEYLVARKAFDITPVQIEATRADLEQARADFITRRSSVFDAEDQLIALMNDPSLNLATGAELVPEDFPALEQIVVDRVAEVQTAIEHRTEIKEQELRIANAKIAVGRAKNSELPRLDLTFRTTFDGLAGNADRSFDELSRTNFIEYFIGVEFEVPIGNRGPRAARRRAQLSHAQARAQLQRTLEDVILDVNLSVRDLETTYDQIGPSFESAEAREREVESIVARAERKDFNTLINELNARQRLANIRRSMLNSMVEYNIALADLERATGTLLEYNNVDIPSEENYTPIVTVDNGG